MHRMKRLLPIFLMLCSICIVFIIPTGTALADSGYTCSGEFCCWAVGDTPPECATTSTQSTSQQPSSTDCGGGGRFQPRACSSQDGQADYDQGLKDGEFAGKMAELKVCNNLFPSVKWVPPPDGSTPLYVQGYKDGWNQGVAEAWESSSCPHDE